MGPTILNGLILLKLPSPVKESLGYVYGKIKPPSEDDPTHSDWEAEKIVVKSWIL